MILNLSICLIFITHHRCMNIGNTDILPIQSTQIVLNIGNRCFHINCCNLNTQNAAFWDILTHHSCSLLLLYRILIFPLCFKLMCNTFFFWGKFHIVTIALCQILIKSFGNTKLVSFKLTIFIFETLL